MVASKHVISQSEEDTSESGGDTGLKPAGGTAHSPLHIAEMPTVIQNIYRGFPFYRFIVSFHDVLQQQENGYKVE